MASTRVGLLALLWGSNFFWIKVSLRGLSPVQLTFARMALGAIVICVVIYGRGLRLPRESGLWVHLVVASLFANVAPYLLFAVGERTVDSHLAGAINATTPLWTFVLVLSLHHRAALGSVFGLLVGFLGAVALLSPWGGGSEVDLAGGAACLAAAASYGVSYVYMDRYLIGRDEPAVLAAGQLAAAALVLAALLPFAGREPVDLRLDTFGAILVLGLIGTGAAYIINYDLIASDGAVRASVVTYLVPLVAVALGWVAGETLRPSMLIGGMAVLVGVRFVRS